MTFLTIRPQPRRTPKNTSQHWSASTVTFKKRVKIQKCEAEQKSPFLLTLQGYGLHKRFTKSNKENS